MWYMEQIVLSNRVRKLSPLFRSPTLETVRMVEKTIEENSGEFKKTQIWDKLPRKVMWPTFGVILNYLQEINKIVTSEEGVITYIWNPKLTNKVKSGKSY